MATLSAALFILLLLAPRVTPLSPQCQQAGGAYALRSYGAADPAPVCFEAGCGHRGVTSVEFYMEDGWKDWKNGDVMLGAYEFPSWYNVTDVNLWKNMFVGGAMYDGWRWHKKAPSRLDLISCDDWDVIHGLIYQRYQGRCVVEVIIGLGGDGHGNFFIGTAGGVLG